ncbi:MAG: enoyl-CoA hydratase/isomerase family protein, partial [Candidatus Heimdallarchaeota archaeon]
MKNELIIVEETDNYGTIIFNNGPLNILTIPMMEQINDALDTFIDNKSLKAVIFDHNGKAFSAGVDIGDH